MVTAEEIGAVVCRGETLEKSMSHYLVHQIENRSNIRMLPRAAVVAAHGDTSLEAIEVRNAASGEPTRHESGGVFIFIGPVKRVAGAVGEGSMAIAFVHQYLKNPEVENRAQRGL